ncbi:bacillithiol biosynthesis cysteine-adding enzyme BshC [Calidifontibacillus oryziterrae]|uniref:bacillithiol biosynthesis cysteine-adding enzyme BshC n=1 Tax=Calidifontibacillus oryziterrae TaxID=1191699 RepID=UPI0002D4E8AB|nr:bacillithiol biosynthesis cysteine-adding enzyme BshC [Calidifontibacillus oryziterrae]
MELMDISLPLTNKIATKYVDGDVDITSFFDYQNINNLKTFSDRLEELKDRKFPREEVSRYLMTFHQKYNVGKQTKENIRRLSDHESVVVIGGQQAGLLSGPLYTVHKVISIIKLAKEQEQLLQVPVIPVFWVAGEDHDFDEINHVFVLNNSKVEKQAISQKQYKKTPASSLEIDKKCGEDWIKQIVTTYGETEHTNKLLECLLSDLQQSDTYVDFFIRIIYRLFPNDGLVVVDSGDPGFRSIGAPFTRQLIEENDQLRENVLAGQITLKELGFGEPIEINERNAHLFFVDNGERLLLEYFDNQFKSKNNQCTFDKAELLEIALKKPYTLCNNVVTRPLMQEYIFPTLAFISGPGEIAYWATLKKAFHLFNFKVPPLVPRLMITLVDRHIKKYVEEKDLCLKQVLENGCDEQREKWLKGQRPFDIDKVTDEVMENIIAVHLPYQQLAIDIDQSLKDLAKKNEELIKTQIFYLKDKMEKVIRQKYDVELRKFDEININLRPLNAPQERVLNIFYYINKYDISFIEVLLQLDYKWNNQHKVVFI